MRRQVAMQPRIPEVTLLEEIGRGPGSVVFRGLHHGNACTVKLPSDRPPKPSAPATSFEQDVLLLARLRRAGLPRVLQLGATGETPYAIFDAAEGRPLSRVLEQRAAEPDAVRLALTLASCLQQLHQAGFLHGSLTSHHVLLSPDGSRVSLLDEGSLTRPVPFDPLVDTQALGLILRDCAKRLQDPTGASAALFASISDELASGTRVELTSVIAELEAHANPRTKRPSSYPPPNREAVAPLHATSRARSELSKLLRVWKQATEHGGKIVEVLGPAGSGKTRLLAAFADKIGEQNAQVLSVKCRDSDWAPFSALKRLLEGHLAGLALLAADRKAEIEASLRAAAGPMASRIRLLSPRLAELFHDATASLEDGDAQQVFVAGMADFLAKYLESSGPAALVIDDIHWLDASSRMVLSRAAARLCPQGHIFVCGARDDIDSREPLARFRMTLIPEFIETVRLGPLSERDTSDLVAEYLGLERPPHSALVQQLSQLSDGTPLCLLELLRLTIERGHLKPHRGNWHLDTAPVQRMRLPASSQALIERRLSGVAQATVEVLRAAAVIRSRIDANLLARMIDMNLHRVHAALDSAVAARLIEIDADGAHGFVHDCIWEALLRGLPEEQQRALHERVANALYGEGEDGPDYEYELARHHAAGMIERNPERAFEALRRAAKRAFDSCDHMLALSFLRPAETAARIAGIRPDREFYLQLAESSLRTGATKQSLEYFEHTLTRSLPGFERAHVRGRIAWIHHFESNAETCWSVLMAALAEVGHAGPENDSLALIAAASRWSAHSLGLRSSTLPQQDAEILCALYNRCMRVSFDIGRPLRFMSSGLDMAMAARQLQPCRAVVHSELRVAFMLSTLGADNRWRAHYSRAEAMARELADPIAETLCYQVHHVIAGWRGDLAEAERQARLCVQERGHWMELGELCHVCFGMYGIEIGRGRAEAALWWLEQAIERAQQSGLAPAIFALIEDAACSTLILLGREKDVASLLRRLRFVERAELQQGSYFHLLSYQSHVQRFTERGDLGAEFEALVEEFDRIGKSPRRVHLLVVMYYVHVGHARVHQCLRASPVQRGALLPKLALALRDIETAARVPGMHAHARVIRAALRWFLGSHSEADRLLGEADLLAQAHGVVWVSYAVARLRAHMLRARGKEDAARDQARIAALLARQYGQHSRLRFIREEFELNEQSVLPARSETDSPYTRRHLDALLHISQANSRELSPERQARFILDELLETLGAERALLFMRDDKTSTLTLHAGRRSGHQDVAPDAEYQRTLVEQVYATGQTMLTNTDDSLESGPGRDCACIVVALVLREQAVGVLYLDRSDATCSFRAEDASLLQALANQVPLALELAIALRERDRLQQNLQQAQKMEAIGRLAGGIAHDFNNILTAIQISAHGLLSMVAHDHEGHEEIKDIQDSARRGADLTRHLLTLSRGQQILPRRIILGEVVRELIPMLHRLVRVDVRIDVDIEDRPLPTLADPGGIERVLMNLCQNASDAMPHGGKITIRVADAENVATRGRHEGRALLAVSDTGTGMSEEVRARLFEPFFTTKGGQRGTGLGLANVYAIVQQCHGQIEVSSEPGAGSTFHIFLPRCQSPSQQDGNATSLEAETTGGETVLVVGHADAARQEMATILERAGYRVLTARDGEDALELVDAHDGLLDVAVIDVHMPGINGSYVAELLLARDPDTKLLFVSGYDPGELQRKGLLPRNAAFLHRPFVPDALVARVHSALQAPPELVAERDTGE